MWSKRENSGTMINPLDVHFECETALAIGSREIRIDIPTFVFRQSAGDSGSDLIASPSLHYKLLLGEPSRCRLLRWDLLRLSKLIDVSHRQVNN